MLSTDDYCAMREVLMEYSTDGMGGLSAAVYGLGRMVDIYRARLALHRHAPSDLKRRRESRTAQQCRTGLELLDQHRTSHVVWCWGVMVVIVIMRVARTSRRQHASLHVSHAVA